MFKEELKIKSVSQISFDHRCRIVEQYCKEYQSFTEVLNNFSGFHDKLYSLKEHKKYPARIKVEGYYQEYWVKCHKTKTSYVFDIWYAA